jgi:hypothetical protein
MTKISMVSSLSKDLSKFVSKEPFCTFEKHTRGMCSKIMKQMGYVGHGVGKKIQGIVNPIVDEHRLKHEGLGFMEKRK